MLRTCLNSINKYSTKSAKNNFQIEQLFHLQILTSDQLICLANLTKSLINNQITLTSLNTQKLQSLHKAEDVLVNVTFEKLESQTHLNKFISDLKQSQNQIIIQNKYTIPEVPWYPRTREDLKSIGNLMIVEEEENKDHPQFTDSQYRQRREEIAKISESHILGEPLPIVNYTNQENETWKKTYAILRDKGKQVMCQRYIQNLNKMEKALGMRYQIPQLRDIDQYLKAETGFRLKACPGILSQREFLNCLAHRVFNCTQYVRHHQYPEYTPEPDMIHEILGHLPMLADGKVAKITQEIGLLSCGASQSDLKRLGTLYWYTLEFGACKEQGQMKAYGAGIASSTHESDNFLVGKFEKLNPFVHADRNYPSQIVQPYYLYSDSFEEAIQNLQLFGNSLNKPFKPYYDFEKEEVNSDKNIKSHLRDQ